MPTDIIAEYKSVSTTQFIIDKSNDFALLNRIKLNEFERIFVIIDQKVSSLYRDILFSKMDLTDKKIYIHEVIAEEKTKSISYYPRLLSFLEEHTAGRYDAVFAIGGGIVIDLVSFTVSTYMRGLPFFVIATTLIGQTDASTAGKTCLNSHEAKNLLGTFYYPRIVYNSIEIMKTCQKNITRQGISEAFKYSLLTDGKLLNNIISFQNKFFDADLMEEIVKSTINARINIRRVDPLASNLGHTFGHAIEKYYNYEILHGDAISIGTILANNYAVSKKIMEQEVCDTISCMMESARLNIFIGQDFDVHKLISYMRKDKKSSQSKLHLVLIEDIGKPYNNGTPFYEASYDEVEAFLSHFIEKYKNKKDNYIEYLKGEEI